MLFAARFVTILSILLFGLALAVWTRRHFGASVALLALFLYSFDPNIIAHGRYVTNDLLLTAFLFLAVIAWSAFLSSRRVRDLFIAGFVLAMAALIKFSGLILVPIFVLLYLIKWWQETRLKFVSGSPRKLSFGHLALSLAVTGGLTVAGIALCYGPETVRLSRPGSPADLLAAQNGQRRLDSNGPSPECVLLEDPVLWLPGGSGHGRPA